MFNKRVKGTNSFQFSNETPDQSSIPLANNLLQTNEHHRGPQKPQFQGRSIVADVVSANRIRNIDNLLAIRKTSEEFDEQLAKLQADDTDLLVQKETEHNLGENDFVKSGGEHEIICNIEAFDDEESFKIPDDAAVQISYKQTLPYQTSEPISANLLSSEKPQQEIDLDFLMKVTPRGRGRLVSDEEIRISNEPAHESLGDSNNKKTQAQRLTYESEILSFQKSVLDSSISKVVALVNAFVTKHQKSIEKNEQAIEMVK